MAAAVATQTNGVHTSLPSVEEHAKDVVSTLFQFITAQGDADYIGEAVSQLEHSLQAAHLACESGADNDTVLGALLHDIGRFIPAADKMPAMIAPNGTYVGRERHEVVGEKYLRDLGFSEKICQLVGAHVMAKRYLTAVDKDYYDGLSQSSKTTLKYQGGIFNDEQVKEAQKDPFLENKLAVRRWDDMAKVPGMKTYPLNHYQDMAVSSLLKSTTFVEVHGRKYELPTRPTVAVCVDGFDPEYLDRGIQDGILPNLAKFVQNGFAATARCAMPSLTNPNNMSIITGKPTAFHGIAGNFFLDKETWQEHLILDDSWARGTTILEQMSNRGVRVAAVTAKDKLKKIIRRGLSPAKGAICFSAEKAHECTLEEHGITGVEEWIGRKSPSQYSGDLSLFVMEAGVKLLEENKADLYYLTLSDFIQHHHAPGSKEANEFLQALDGHLGRLAELGAIVTVTGDHGMSDKATADGKPNVLFLQDALAERWGSDFARVICPITDPYVKHHGSLGSFVRVHLKQKNTDVNEVLEFCKTLPQVEVAMDGESAAAMFQMPLEREADIVVISKKNAVIGSSNAEHDLSTVAGHRLRSHGGLSEEHIPLIMSVPLDESLPRPTDWRNFDIFYLALNLPRV